MKKGVLVIWMFSIGALIFFLAGCAGMSHHDGNSGHGGGHHYNQGQHFDTQND